MKKLLIIGPSDSIFISHLEKVFSLEFYRSFYELGNKSNTKILAINQSEKEAEKFLEKNPLNRIFMLKGGKKSFTPIISIINPDYNHQYLDFNSFENLIKIIDKPPIDRGKSPLKYHPYLNHYTLAPSAPQPGISFAFFAEQIEANIKLLEMERENLKRLSQGKSRANLTTFSREADLISFEIEGYFQFESRYVKVLSEYENVYFIAQVIKAENGILTVRPIVREKQIVSFYASDNKQNLLSYFELYHFNVCYISPDYGLILKQYDLMQKNLKAPFADKGPLGFLTGKNDNICPAWQKINHIILSEKEKLILRDPQQAKLLSLALSDISVLPITGGPGSGKTMLTALIIKKFLENKMSILCMAHSNFAVKALLQQISKFVNKKSIVVISNNPIFEKHGIDDLDELIERVKCSGDPLVVLSTIGSYHSHSYFKKIREKETYFPITIFDEASMLKMAECILALKYTTRKAIFVGDKDQLQGVPFHVNKGSDSAKLVAFQEVSMFERLCNLLDYPKLLCNRRSLPKLIDYINKKFNKNMRYGRFNPNFSGRVEIVNLSKGKERARRKSWINHHQAQVVVDKLKDYIYRMKQEGKSIEKDSILIIVPYRAQVDKIMSLLEKEKRLSPLFSEIDIHQMFRVVNTASSFQGQEADLVILSLVRDNLEKNKGFIDPRLLYVAQTRARDYSVIITAENMEF